MYEMIGILLCIVPILFTTWWVLGEHSHKGWAFAICIVALFIGAFLILEERAAELTVNGIGTINSAAKQAKVDAKAVTDLKDHTEAQTAIVDLFVKETVEAKQLLNDLKINIQVAENKLSRLDGTIANSNLAVRELQQLTDLNITILSAKNDSRQDYEQLQIWGQDSSFRFQKEAALSAQNIINQHNPSVIKSGFGIAWNGDIDPQLLSIDELWEAFSNPNPNVRIGILEFVWEERADIPLKERLQFLIDVLRRDDSLLVIEYAGRYFGEGTNDGYSPIAIDSHLNWWEENKESIE